jgi:hypothetical protein
MSEYLIENKIIEIIELIEYFFLNSYFDNSCL